MSGVDVGLGGPRWALSAALGIIFAVLAQGCGRESAMPPPAASPTDADSVEALVADPSADRRHRPYKAALPGRFRLARDTVPPDSLTPGQKEQFERIRAIGYVGGSVASTKSGLTVWAREETDPGLNFYASGHGPEAFLIDMRGRVLHRWRYDYSDAWPERQVDNLPNTQWWRRAVAYPNGDVLAIFEGFGLIRIDRDSKLLWANGLRIHHDLHIRPGGGILVLTREIRERPGKGDLILEDFLTTLSDDGDVEHRVSILEAFRRSPFRDLIDRGKRTTGDIFHTNTIHVLNGTAAATSEAFAAGNVLTSMNALGVIAVLDPGAEEIVWARRLPRRAARFLGQHDPQVVGGDRILLFENHWKRLTSRVSELDIATLEPHWTFEGSRAVPFFSGSSGAVQRLANGNTLITETDNGRALEVRRDGRIVWEYYNPNRAGDDDGYIAAIADMIRLPLEWGRDWAHPSGVRGQFPR